MSNEGSVAIFWDLDRVPPDSDSNAVNEAILSVAQRRGPVTLFKGYTDGHVSMENRLELQSVGVVITGCQSNEWKSNMISVDMMARCMDHAIQPVSIVLISHERELAYTLSALLLHGIDVLVIAPEATRYHLTASATHFVAWEQMPHKVSSVSSCGTPAMKDAEKTIYPDALPLKELPLEETTEGATRTPSPTLSEASTVVPLALLKPPSPEQPPISFLEAPVAEQPPISFLEAPVTEAISTANGKTSLENIPSAGVEDKNTPFQALVDELLRCTDMRPEYATIDNALRARNPAIYTQAGATTFAQYASLAAQEGIVIIGQFRTTNGTTSWLSLVKDIRPLPAPSIMLDKYQFSNMPNLLSEPSNMPDTSRFPSIPNLFSEPTPKKPVDLMFSNFQALIILLRELGGGRVEQGTVVAMLKARDPLFYRKAVAKSAAGYMNRAVKGNVIIRHKEPGLKWVELCSKWLLPVDDRDTTRALPEQEATCPDVLPLKELQLEDTAEGTTRTPSPALSEASTVVPLALLQPPSPEQSSISFSEAPVAEAISLASPEISLANTPLAVSEVEATPFQALIKELLICPVTRPEYATIDNALRAHNPAIYTQAGVGTFAQYASLAAQKGIITIGQFRTTSGIISWLSLVTDIRPLLVPSNMLDTSRFSNIPKLLSEPTPKKPLDPALSPFQDLIILLRKLGGGKVERQTVAAILKGRDPLFHSRVTAKSLVKYFNKADKEGVITRGKEPGFKWMKLCSKWLLPVDYKDPSRALPEQEASQTPTTNYSVPKFIPNVLNFGPQTKQTEGPHCPLDDSSNASHPLTTSMRDELRDDQTIPPTGFTLLIEILQEMRDNGVPRPYQSTVHAHIIDQNPGIYEESGIQNFTEYFNLAKDMGIVELGGAGVRQYISLLS